MDRKKEGLCESVGLESWRVGEVVVFSACTSESQAFKSEIERVGKGLDT